MTLAQCSASLGVPPKRVQNACAALGLPLRYRESDVRRLGLALRLSDGIGLKLHAAWRLAGVAFAQQAAGVVRIPAGDVAVTEIDVRRYLSDWAAASARVRELAPPRGPGRPRRPNPPEPAQGLAAARAYGLDVTALAESLRHSPAERLRALDENWQFVHAMQERGGRHR
jgi:hypothetical protein